MLTKLKLCYVCVTGKHKHPLVSNNIINSNNNHNSNNHINGIIKECDNHHQINEQHQQFIINNNNHRGSMISNGTATYNGSSNSLILNNNNNNNKGDYNSNNNNNNAIVTNNKIYHHLNHHITNNNNVLCNNNNQNGVSKSVILNYDKNTLEYKNNKNLILNQHQNINKVDVNGNNTTTHNNGYANNHQIYEKHLNGINQLKNELQSTKRFIITSTGTPNGTDNCENNQKSHKYHINIAKNRQHNGTSITQPSIDEPDNGIVMQQHHPITNGLMKNRLITAAAVKFDKDNNNENDTANVLENIPANVNIHKVNGLNLNSNGHHHNHRSNNIIKNGHSVGTVKVTELSNGNAPARNGYHHEQQSQKTNGFVRNCSNGRLNDFSTIKINYVSRQVAPPRGHHSSSATSNGNTVSSTNGHATNGNSHCNSNNNNSNNNHFHHGTVSLHENPKNTTSATNIPSIPNIVINGSNDGTSINGDYERKEEENLKNNKKNGKKNSKFLYFSFCLCLFSHAVAFFCCLLCSLSVSFHITF